MDPNSTNARTVRFKPIARTAKNDQKLFVPKVEKDVEDARAAVEAELERRYNERAFNVRPKIEKKEENKVAIFGQTASSNQSYNRQNVKSQSGPKSENGVDKKYEEPWHKDSYYPVTLPLRQRDSGDPEFLDELEFGNGLESQKYDEDSIIAAEQLGLTVVDYNHELLLFLQLPSKLPMPLSGKDTDVNGTAPNKSKNRVAYTLDELPEGYMGKLVVYKSGAVKLKLGDNLYDVASGVDSKFAQDVVAINSNDKRCSAVGEPNKRAIITPDLDSVFDNKLEL